MNCTHAIVIAACALIGLLPAPARADGLDAMQDLLGNSETTPLPSGWTLGGVVYHGSSTYQAGPSTNLPIPGGVYLGDDAMYLGDRLYYTFGRQGPFRFYGRLRVRSGNLNPDDAAEWAGMSARKWQLEAGVGAVLVSSTGLWTARISSDVSGRSHGSELLLNWSAPLVVGERWLLMPSAGVFWRSSHLANYYFGGVSPAEAAPGRPAYDVGSTWSFTPALISSYRFSPQWVAGLVLSYERLAGATQDSPIGQKKGRHDILLGLGYVLK